MSSDSNHASDAPEPPVDSQEPAKKPISRKRIFTLGVICVTVAVVAVSLIENPHYVPEAISQRTFFPIHNLEMKLENAKRLKNFPLFAFDLRRLSVPRQLLQYGGVQKDGIPALVNSDTVSAAEGNHLAAEDRVIGVNIDGTTRAYPIKILRHHEISNDKIGDVDFAVTYCPLCDSAAAFNRNTGTETLELRVSGLLYKNNVVMFNDHDDPEINDTLWLQLLSQGISGDFKGIGLESVPIELTTWKEWKERNPETTVLTTTQGFEKDYNVNHYARYEKSPEPMFELPSPDMRLPHKEKILGVWSESTNRAYPVSLFSAEVTQIEDEIDGLKLTIEYNPETESLRVAEADEGLSWMYSYWFAWAGIREETEIYKEAELLETPSEAQVTTETAL
ncbi:MAG: DUF3179 domain-containing protein [Planctomycetaceae bacterium]